MADKVATFLVFLIVFTFYAHSKENLENIADVQDIAFSSTDSDQQKFGVLNGTKIDLHYLLYDVNPGEGFNLRRDVYMRVANLVKFLNQKDPLKQWVLVVPPWGRLYHWKTPGLQQTKIPWHMFFDMDSLNKLVPVIELQTYLQTVGNSVEEVMYLQRYEEGWTDGKWEERIDERDCLEKTGFEKNAEGRWRWWFWGYGDQMWAERFRCMSCQFQYHSMVDYIHENINSKSLVLLRSETMNHGRDSNWSPVYWTARRSMRFAKHLRDIGDKFRREHLNSTDEEDQTVLEPDWTKMKRKHGDALGGPYIAVHLRRKDFLYSHSKEVPPLEMAATQIKEKLHEHFVNTVFVATDAPPDEVEELQNYMSGYKVVQYRPSKYELETYMDGGVAIIDQWICAHARYFMGTSVSTFSFRIQEEREILGFEPDSTYNRFCGPGEERNCKQPTRWEAKYE